MADRVYLHQLFVKHKNFLKKLYSEQTAYKVLNGATEEEINVVLKILHLLGDSQIPVDSSHKEALIKAKRTNKLAELGSRIVFRKVMRQTRSEKLKIVKHFASLYPRLLHLLFK